MARRVLLVGWAAVLGCGGPPAEVVARVNQWRLDRDRLAELMVLAQPVPLTADVAYELASHWVTLMALGQRAAAGDSLLDSLTIRDLMAYRVRQEVTTEWRRRLQARVPPAAAASFDSSYAQRLLEDRRARLEPHATALLRQFATDPWQMADATQPWATYAGGVVTTGQLQRYVQYLSPSTRGEIRGASDQRITGFLWGFVLEELLVEQAESAGVAISEAAFGAMAQEARDVVHNLWEHTGLAPASLASAGASSGARAQAARRRVDEYLEAAAARRVTLEAVPPFLAVPLLRRVEWEIAADRMTEVVDRARRLLAATASVPTP